MNIDNAIAKLNEFKKVAKKLSGKCELVEVSDSSFIFKVDFDKEDSKRRPVIGFAQS